MFVVKNVISFISPQIENVNEQPFVKDYNLIFNGNANFFFQILIFYPSKQYKWRSKKDFKLCR